MKAKPLKAGAPITMPRFEGRRIVGVQRARAYPKARGDDAIPDGSYWAYPTNAAHSFMWWFTHESEYVLWCRGWSGPTVQALKAAMALQ